MKPVHDLDLALKAAGGLAQFFDVKYQKKFRDDSNVIYIIDEAQSSFYFPRLFKHNRPLVFSKRVATLVWMSIL